MYYKCKKKCTDYKIGGSLYVGTRRTKKEPEFQLKYCRRCVVYFDTLEIRCECCNLPLRNSPRNKYDITIQ